MRTIVFFDLPNIYAKDKRNYNLFRKFLINEGFIMLQESVYSKIVLNSIQANLLTEKIKKNAPKKGLIQLMTITEKQYSQIQYIIGEPDTKIINIDIRIFGIPISYIKSIKSCLFVIFISSAISGSIFCTFATYSA